MHINFQFIYTIHAYNSTRGKFQVFLENHNTDFIVTVLHWYMSRGEMDLGVDLMYAYTKLQTIMAL